MDTALTLPPGGEPAATLDGIMALERAMLKLEDEGHGLDVVYEHWFTGKLYARCVHVPAGGVCTSLVHKTRNISVLIQGSCTVVGEDGSRKEMAAPAIWITEPGTKRAVYAHDDLMWLSVLPCAAMDVDGAEDEVFADASTVEEYRRVMADLALPAPETVEV